MVTLNNPSAGSNESATKLLILSDVERSLASIRDVDEAKSIRDRAESIRVYARSSRLGLNIQNRAAAIKIQAEQRAGELLAKIGRENGGRGKTGSMLKQVCDENKIGRPVAHRWQRMATLSAGKVQAFEAEFTEKGEELTSAFIYHYANGGAHVGHNTGKTEWYTSGKIVELARKVMGAINLDPASHPDAQKIIKADRFFTEKEDGLRQTWKGNVFLNPPYSQPLILRFCEKLIVEINAGNLSQAITLTNNATETAWGQLLLRKAPAVCFPSGRKVFWSPVEESVPLQGQMLCYFGDNRDNFLKHFEGLGACLLLR